MCFHSCVPTHVPQNSTQLNWTLTKTENVPKPAADADTVMKVRHISSLSSTSTLAMLLEKPLHWRYSTS